MLEIRLANARYLSYGPFCNICRQFKFQTNTWHRNRTYSNHQTCYHNKFRKVVRNAIFSDQKYLSTQTYGHFYEFLQKSMTPNCLTMLRRSRMRAWRFDWNPFLCDKKARLHDHFRHPRPRTLTSTSHHPQTTIRALQEIHWIQWAHGRQPIQKVIICLCHSVFHCSRFWFHAFRETGCSIGSPETLRGHIG